MAIIKQISKNSFVEIVPARCFFSTKERFSQSGVLADLNADINLHMGEEKLTLCRLNNLRIQMNHNSGEWFIGSDRKDIVRKGEHRDVVTGQIYYVAFLPQNKDDDNVIKLQAEVMAALIEDCKDFVKKARVVRDDKENGFRLPKELEDMVEDKSIDNKTPQKGNVEFGDMPF